MGLSSTKTKTTSKETATTKPEPYAPAVPAIENYYGKLPGLFNTDPNVFAPQSNALLDQATAGAKGLGSQTGLNEAANYTWQLANQLQNQKQPNAVKAGLPGAISATNVNGPAAPTAAQATVANLAPAALAMDTSGLAGKDVATYGGATAKSYMDQYLDPQLDGYVKAYLTNFDDTAGREKAAYQAQGAMNGAFGGSRYGIGEAQLTSDLANKRALGEAGLRSDAFKTALGAGQSDAANANSAGIASMEAQNQRDETLAGLAAQLGMFNAGQVNDRSQSLFDALNQASLFNTGQTNDLNSLIFGEQSTNARQNASAANDVNKLLYTTTADNNRFNADQANSMASSNANRVQAGLGAALQGAGQYADIQNSMAANDRSNIGLQADLGQYLSQMQLQQALAPYTQAGVQGDLLNPQLLSILSGQTVSGSKEGTTKESMNLLQSLIAAGSKVGSAFAGGA